MANNVFKFPPSGHVNRKNPTLDVTDTLTLSEVFLLSGRFLKKVKPDQEDRIAQAPGQAMKMAAFLLKEGTLKKHWKRGVKLAIEAVHAIGQHAVKQEQAIIETGLEIIPVVRERLKTETALDLLVNMGVSNHADYDERIVPAWEAFIRQASGGNQELLRDLVLLSVDHLNNSRRANPLVRRAEAMLEEMSVTRG